MTAVFRTGYAGDQQPSTAAGPLIVDQQGVERKPLGPRSVTRANIMPIVWNYVGDPGQPAFQNSWVNSGLTNDLNARFGMDALGCVLLGGAIKSGTITATIFTLPTAYRPSKDAVFAVDSQAAYGSVIVQADGQVIAAVGSNLSFFLHGIRFPVT